MSDSSMEGAWQQVESLVLKRVSQLEQAVLDALSGQLQPEARAQAVREAHKLHGTLGSFGFPRASRLAAEIEKSLERLNSPEEAYALSFLLADLRQSLSQVQEAPLSLEGAAEAEGSADARPSLLYRGAAGALLDELRQQSDLTVQLQMKPDQAPPALIVLGQLDLEEARHLGRNYKDVPMLAVADQPLSLSNRVEALRAGVLRLLDGQSSLDSIVQEIARLAHLDRSRAFVLALDDDPVMLRLLKRLLMGQGVQLEAVSNPQQFWSSLSRQKPDIVLLDLEMPDFSGQEICQSLRSNPATEDIPVIVITATEDADVLVNLYAAGVDDCLQKPIRSRELIFRIRNRLERVQAIRRHSLQEPETGAWSAQHGKPLGLRMLRLAERTQSRVTLAVVQFDQPRRSEVVLQLVRSLRDEDLICRWHDERLLLGLYGAGSEDAAALLEQLLARLQRELEVQGWIGLACYPEHGTVFELLLERASACLELACQGQARVVSFGRIQGGATSEMLDVVLVEDDPLLGEVIVHSLESRHLRVRWIQDGQQAIDQLSGAIPELRPRVVILDIDLPGASGLEILRHFRDEGTLDRTRVIMLTVRANEAETLETLSLGAYDHLSKPCSLQVLLQRVQLALQAP